MAFHVNSLFTASAALKLPMFVALFLVVRGAPALVLYRSVLEWRDRLALAAFCATELPLVVAITTLATESNHMRESTAAALVGAAIISTLIYPLLGLRLRQGRTGEEPAPAPA
jgi:Kef-type K+ transport system membrane component KefB